MTRYLPIIAPELDPRNEFQLAAEAKERVVTASNNQLTDISPGSPVSALCEGMAFTQAELLYYLNQAPEAWTATFLSQVLGIQIVSSKPSTVVIEFTREDAVLNTPYVISAGFRLQSNSGVVFETQDSVEFAVGEKLKYVIANSLTEGSVANVGPQTISIPLQGISGFSSITNPSSAYGGTDGESYLETKARAFSQIRRRNPVSVADYEDLVEDILGNNVRIRVTPQSSSPQVQIVPGLFIEPNSDANVVFQSLLDFKRITGQEAVITDSDVNIVTQSLSTKTRDSEHIFVSVRGIDDVSIDPLLLEKTRRLVQNRAAIGTIVHIENALVQLVDITVVLQNDDLTVSGTIESTLREYFSNVGFGEPLDYSIISSVISRFANIVNIFLTTGFIFANQGLPSQSVVDNVILTASRLGITIISRPAGQTGGTYFTNTDIIPAYGPGTLWTLNEVNIVPSSEFLNLVPFGSLLECRSDFTSIRADGEGGTYETANDQACIAFTPDQVAG